MKTLTTYETLQAAILAVRTAESKGLSERTMNKYYRVMFAAEDAYKAEAGAWA